MSLVSIVTVSIRPSNIFNILNNFSRQIYSDKELILIFNKKSFDIDNIKNIINKYNINYKLIIIDDKKSLGVCLNSSLKYCSGKYWSKFDDDDYYGKRYLTEAIYYLKNKIYKIIGKNSGYIFDKINQKLYLKKGPQSEVVNFIKGGTITCDITVFNKVKFPNKNVGEDTEFLRNCVANNIKIYTSKYNDYIHIRGEIKDHTWKMGISDILGNNSCIINNSVIVDRIRSSYSSF